LFLGFGAKDDHDSDGDFEAAQREKKGKSGTFAKKSKGIKEGKCDIRDNQKDYPLSSTIKIVGGAGAAWNR
jgi:hypothetical protein